MSTSLIKNLEEIWEDNESLLEKVPYHGNPGSRIEQHQSERMILVLDTCSLT